MLAHARLAEDPGCRGAIGLVATEFCFADQFAFSKAFRREFGLTPSEVRASLGFDAQDALVGTKSKLSLKTLLS